MSQASSKPDFRAPTVGKRAPRAVADGPSGVIVAIADVGGTPERAFRALTTSEVEVWWRFPGLYHQRDFHADLRPCGAWSVAVQLNDGHVVHAHGEFCALEAPHRLVMTRSFDRHPFLGARETTITYRFEPSPHGTLITVREEGFVGRSEAAFGNAEIWERVLGWLDGYLSAS